MASHIINGEFQSDKYPTCPPGKVPLRGHAPKQLDVVAHFHSTVPIPSVCTCGSVPHPDDLQILPSH